MVTDDRDHLTQLLTKAALDAALPVHFANATAAQPASLIIADVDHFKKVNDTHGHPVGDIVLKDLAARFKQTIQGKGSAYRYGGEEFAAILPNHAPGEAVAVAERARLAVEAAAVGGLSITSSYGVAVAPTHASTVDEWLRNSDQALYDAKRLGRNLVRLFGEPVPQQPQSSRPARKQPEPGTLSDEKKEEMRLMILRLGRAFCPFDEIPFEVHDATSQGDLGRSFIVHCPACGFQADLPSPKRS